MRKKSPEALVVRNLNARRVALLAQRPEGVAAAEVTGIPPSTVGRLLLDLCQELAIYQGKASYRFCRYFGTREKAATWATENAKQNRVVVVRSVTQPPGAGARWAPNATVTWPTHPDGTPAYKLTVAPKPPAGAFRTGTFSRAA